MKPIALLPGDGIGPEVMAEAVKVLKAVGERFSRTFAFETYLFGGAAIEECGVPFPDETLAGIRQSSAVLFGAVGDPKWDHLSQSERPESGILRLRSELDMFANLRPVQVDDALLSHCPLRTDYARNTNLLIVRELTSGIYYGEKTREMTADGEEVASDLCFYKESQIERIARVAFETAQKRRKLVHSIDKANVMSTSRLWRETVTRVGQDYPDVELQHMLVDNAAMQLIRKPSQFDVIVTENLFGDILSDEASMLSGSIGMIPSASLGAELSLYEPIHGSAPDIVGLGLANPVGMILSAAMMLEYSFGFREEAQAIREAVQAAFRNGYRTRDMLQVGTEAVTTSEMGSVIAEYILNPAVV